MSDREFAVLHNGEEIFRGTEDEFGEQCEHAADNALGPLNMTDKGFQQYVDNPYRAEATMSIVAARREVKAMTPLLLQPVRVISASEDNPTKVGLFLRMKRITGVMNRGSYWELLNADGSTSCIPVTNAVPICKAEELPAVPVGEWIDCLYSGFMKKVSWARCARFVNIAMAMLPYDDEEEDEDGEDE